MKRNLWFYCFLLLLTLTSTNFAQENNESNIKAEKGNIVLGKSTRLIQPPYPPAAAAVKASGVVLVEVIGDENGDVVFARATDGHPLLRSASVSAARSSKFSTSLFEGKPTKFTAIIAYNYVLSDRGINIQIGKLEIAPKLTDEEIKEIKINTKFVGKVSELVKKMKQGANLKGFDFVRDAKAEVLVWLTDYSPTAFEELETNGFEIKAELGNLKRVKGIIAVEKLRTLAELENVRSIEPR